MNQIATTPGNDSRDQSACRKLSFEEFFQIVASLDEKKLDLIQKKLKELEAPECAMPS